MQLKTNYTEERTVDIELPFFRKKRPYGSTVITRFIGAISEEAVHELFHSDDMFRLSVNKAEQSKSTIIEAYFNDNEWEPCSEEEFLEAHAKTWKSLSLVPTLIVKDDLPSGLFTEGVSETEREIVEELEQKNLS